jgi:hypothetical protein
VADINDFQLKIFGNPGKVSAHALKIGIQQTVGLLDEYAVTMAEKEHSRIRWNVRELSSNGSLRVVFHPSVISKRRKGYLVDNSANVASNVVSGIATIDRDGIAPPYLSENGMNRIQSFVGVIEHHQADAFNLEFGGMSADVTKETGEKLAKIIEVKRRAIGSIEGRLVGINIAKVPRLSIIHHITKRAITCDLSSDQDTKVAIAELGKQVSLYGMLSKNINGDTVRIKVRDGGIRVLGSNSVRQHLARISNLPIPDFAKTRDTDEYLLGTRGE